MNGTELANAAAAAQGTMPVLAWTIYLSFLGAAGLLVLCPDNHRGIRTVALMTALSGLLVAVVGALQFPGGPAMVTVVNVPWVAEFGIRYHLAVDGISIVLVLLTGVASVAGVLFSWNIATRVKEFFALYFGLIGAVYGVFLSFDLFLFFVFYELAIVPKYFLIAIWGSTRREYGAMKLALYSFVGSAMVLIGLIAAYVVSGATTFGLVELANFSYPREFQMWAFPLVFVGFAILAGMWPFHTWAPTGHVAAPTGASMLLAGVIMKLGAYGCLRGAMTLFPLGMADWASPVLGFTSWRDVFGLLAVIGIVYGALVALVQKDFKFVIGYSSVSHMGFVLLGLMTLSTIGLSGAVLQMFSHGIIAGLLFGVVGRMVYDRTHTRELDQLETMQLNRHLPFAAVTFVAAGLASMGMPGFSGFVAELQVLIGAWKAFPMFAVVGGAGVLIGVAYTLRAIQKSFFTGTPTVETVAVSGVATGASSLGTLPVVTSDNHDASDHPGELEDISVPERIGAAVLIGITLVIGLFPSLLLDWIVPALESPLLQRMMKTSAP